MQSPTARSRPGSTTSSTPSSAISSQGSDLTRNGVDSARGVPTTGDAADAPGSQVAVPWRLLGKGNRFCTAEFSGRVRRKRGLRVFERFTERARQVVVLAQDEARALKHNYIGTEHILLGLLRE